MIGVVSISTTTDDRAVADAIARAAIERRLGACARIHPVESVYRWNGEICAAREFVVEIKTTAAARPAVEAMIRELQAYDLPEITVHEIVGGAQDYLDWIAAETRPTD